MADSDKKKAVILLSGGVDSTTCLAIARSQGYECNALSFRYGQRHAREVEAAQKIASLYEAARHLVLNLDLAVIGGSSLTTNVPIPKRRSMAEISHGIPSTYVPARNTLFLAYALSWAEVLGARDIFIGVNAIDYSGYPDCRPEFIEAFQKTARLGTRMGAEGEAVTIHTPLLRLSKGEIVKMGSALGVDYGLTLSCYDPYRNGHACGECDSCLLRLKGFEEAGLADPLAYGP